MSWLEVKYSYCVRFIYFIILLDLLISFSSKCSPLLCAAGTIRSNRQDYSSVYSNLYISGYHLRMETVLNWMVASIPLTASTLNFFPNVILNCYYSSQTVEPCHISKGSSRHLCVTVQSWRRVKWNKWRFSSRLEKSEATRRPSEKLVVVRHGEGTALNVQSNFASINMNIATFY
jgi:hypothetical protein